MCPLCRISNTTSPSLLPQSITEGSWSYRCPICLCVERTWLQMLGVPVSSFLARDEFHRVGRKWGKALPTSWGNSMQVFLTDAKGISFSFSALRMIRDASHWGLVWGLHRQLLMAGVLVYPSARAGGCLRWWGSCVFLSARCDPLHPTALKTGDLFSPRPSGMPSASGGENPRGSDTGDGGESSPTTR